MPRWCTPAPARAGTTSRGAARTAPRPVILELDDDPFFVEIAETGRSPATLGPVSSGVTYGSSLILGGTYYWHLYVEDAGQLRGGSEIRTLAVSDTDGDTLSDLYESGRACLDFQVDDAGLDADGDSLSSLNEALGETDPCNADSDNDGLDDGAESIAGTDPLLPDTDGDGLSDGDEVHLHGTDPLNVDTDGDGLTDGDEINVFGSDPLLTDTDGDGLDDASEVQAGTDPTNPDTDGDGLGDGAEIFQVGTDPLDPDSDDDGLDDGSELAIGTDPLNPDTDGDTMPDGLDNCPLVANSGQENADADGLGDACDNCPGVSNQAQDDLDLDGEGDWCDLDDGLILFTRLEGDLVEWQNESVYMPFNLYRGDLDTLRCTGVYTQAPGVPEAARFCGELTSSRIDVFLPVAGKTAFYLVTGMSGAVETTLGETSTGAVRPNDNPCP